MGNFRGSLWVTLIRGQLFSKMSFGELKQCFSSPNDIFENIYSLNNSSFLAPQLKHNYRFSMIMPKNHGLICLLMSLPHATNLSIPKLIDTLCAHPTQQKHA